MTRDYAPTRPIRTPRRQVTLTARGHALLYGGAVLLGLVLGLTAQVWDPFARVVAP